MKEEENLWRDVWLLPPKHSFFPYLDLDFISFHHRSFAHSCANFFRNHFRCCTHLPNATKNVKLKKKELLKVDRFSFLSCLFSSTHFDSIFKADIFLHHQKCFFFLRFSYCVQVGFFHSLLSHPYTLNWTFSHFFLNFFQQDKNDRLKTLLHYVCDVECST